MKSQLSCEDCSLLTFVSSVLIFHQVIPSGRSIATPSSVHQTGRPSPWLGEPACLSQQSIKVEGIAAVFPPAPFLLQKASLAQVMQRALYCGSRQAKICCDGLDRRPAAAFCVGTIFEVHIHRSRAMVQIRRIDCMVKAHPALLHCVRITGRGRLESAFPFVLWLIPPDMRSALESSSSIWEAY